MNRTAPTRTRLSELAARGTAAAAEPSPPYCAECDKRDRPALLTPLIAGWRCERCRRVFVDVDFGGVKGRWVQP